MIQIQYRQWVNVVKRSVVRSIRKKEKRTVSLVLKSAVIVARPIGFSSIPIQFIHIFLYKEYTHPTTILEFLKAKLVRLVIYSFIFIIFDRSKIIERLIYALPISIIENQEI